MPTPKLIQEVLRARSTLEGAGVRLHRGFANTEVPRFDPFLLFDDFSSPNPADYLAGFPMHPHRGIETVTYILEGNVRHRDSIGNSGVIGKGDIQWMTAGNGIIHEEMPEGTDGIKGFQLWVNLPSENKMMPPRYQELKKKSIPEIAFGKHVKMHVIAGAVENIKGPVEDIVANPLYLDINLEPEKTFDFPLPEGHTVFVYIFDGALGENFKENIPYGKGSVILFTREGNSISVRAGASGARFLLVSGKPLNEPVAWFGPIVMNTQAELQTAYQELREGVFVKKM